MKKLVLAALISALSIFGSNDIYAQHKNSSKFIQTTNNTSQTKALRPSVAKRANQLKKELSLNEKQAEEVKILLNNHFEKAASIRAKKEGDENFFENLQLRAARMEFHRDLKKILDKEQRKKLDAFRDKRKTEKKFTAR